jgi:hypothetical protein
MNSMTFGEVRSRGADAYVPVILLHKGREVFLSPQHSEALAREMIVIYTEWFLAEARKRLHTPGDPINTKYLSTSP